MLTSFHLKNFKSFKQDAVLPLASLTVLIGANAAGKSNALEGLRLLSWLAQGNKLSAIQHAVNQADKVVRGRVPDIFQKGETKFTLGCSMDAIPGANVLDMELELRGDDLHIVAERMGSGNGIPLYDMDQASKGHSTEAGVAYNNFSKGGNKPHIPVSDQMAVFAQLDSPASFHANHKSAQQQIPRACKRYQDVLSNILFLDPAPAKMRDFSFLADKRLGGDGANLSSVLFRLWYGGGHAEFNHVMEEIKNNKSVDIQTEVQIPDLTAERQEILSFIQSLPEQDIQGLSFLKGPRNDVMVQLVESFGGVRREYESALLSDGTLRVLAIAAAMLSAPEGSLVVIEEIDNGVHPSRARHLLERIQTVAERRKLRVLLSTHNPAMLDALPDKAVPDVVFCYRDPVLGDSRLVRLGSLPDAPELLIQDTLGHLMTTGALERFVKTHPGSQARKEKAKAWLASLKATEHGGPQ
ncbi:MAG: ATPase [Burkholderiales bacterium RIFCSPLOWO2_12_FULL_61_40]|nr:MAG: ATPase [Burkholderiales bacterium RIFCSPLOWO2_12_FULL_61_40]